MPPLSRPTSTTGVNEFLSSFHLTPSAKGAVTKKATTGKDEEGDRKVVILPFHLSLPKKGCGKWLVAQDARQHEPFPTGLEMIRGRAFCTNTHFSPPHMLFSPPLCTHDLPPPYFIIPQIRQSLIEPRERHLILRSAFFFSPNSIPEIPEARNLNWKTEIWCSFAFGGRPIKG